MFVSLFMIMEVNRAIERLLYLEDCVIIPGLGGFISQCRPAMIDRGTGTFLPPAKEILFHPDLVQNDGILVRYLAAQNNISQERARRQIDDYVSESQLRLYSGAAVPIEGIGHFLMDPSGVVRFRPEPGINLSLDSFGLAPFTLREIQKRSAGKAIASPLPGIGESPVTIGFPIEPPVRRQGNRNLRRIAIAMPLLIVFSLLPYHSRISNTLSSSSAGLMPEPALFRLDYPATKDTVRTIVFPVEEEKVMSGEVKSDGVTSGEVTSDGVTSDKVTSDGVTSDGVTSDRVTSDGAKPEEVKPVKIAEGKYPVVAGCFKVKENADKLLGTLTQKGYPSFIKPMRNGLYKVIVETFASREDAVSGLARIKAAEPGLELWAAL